MNDLHKVPVKVKAVAFILEYHLENITYGGGRGDQKEDILFNGECDYTGSNQKQALKTDSVMKAKRSYHHSTFNEIFQTAP